MSPAQLQSGDQQPHVIVTPPGPRSVELCERLAQTEAPGVNTLYQGRPGIVWEEALGANVLDVDGNIYVDLTAGFGVAAIGHRHPWVVEAVQRQSEILVHGLADVAAHPTRVALAERLAALAPMAEPRVHFAISGGDAVEVALKTAWLNTGKPTVVAFEPAYHGTTLGALAATSRPEFREPFRRQLNPHVVRLRHGCDIAEVEALFSSRDDVAAVLVEPIPGREGYPAPERGWLAAVADRSRDAGALLIADEVFTGFGRTGTLFACEDEGVAPDILCCGKALGGGMPLAAVLASADRFAVWDRGGEAIHTATFLAHPLACAAGLATLELLERESLPVRAQQLGRLAAERVSIWEGYPSVSALRGRGLFWVLEMTSATAASTLAQRALEAGVIVLAAGQRLQLVPPLTIDDSQWVFALDLIQRLLETPPES